MLTILRFLTAGESHGPRLTGVLEGLPAGLTVDRGRVDEDLARRQRGSGSGGRMDIERDRVRITAGVMAGLTTGAPVALEIENLDWENWRDRDVDPMVTPRPGHADLTGAIKYGYPDLRPALERASARETAMRVAVGGICRQVLGAFGIVVGGYTLRIGGVEAALPSDPGPDEYRRRFETARRSDVCCPELDAAARMQAAIDLAEKQGDTLGGIIEVAALGVPAGLGSHVHWDRRLDARLAMALVSIQAMKGVQIGPAFTNAALSGTGVHDEIFLEEGRLERRTNRAGGLEGGITNGEPVVVQAAMKPISTTRIARASVDLAAGVASRPSYERSDVCAVPRAVVVCEAMASIVLADALLLKLGGDSLEEMRPRFEALRAGRLDDLSMDAKPWRPACDD
ncbi:MAG: chorismate synthase [Deltaproteobacteria bacterium]|nr:chorismate synthase [Deltaproteobacteria bacterium]